MNRKDRDFCEENNIPIIEIELEKNGKFWRAPQSSSWSTVEAAAYGYFAQKGLYLDLRFLLLHILASRVDPESEDGLAQYSLLGKFSRFSPISYGNLGSANLRRIRSMVSDPNFSLSDLFEILRICYDRDSDIKKKFPLYFDLRETSPVLPRYFDCQQPPQDFATQIEKNFQNFDREMPEMFDLTFPIDLLDSLTKLEKLEYEVSQSIPCGDTQCDISLTDFIQSIRRPGRHALPPITNLEEFKVRLDAYISSLPEWRWQDKTWVGASIISLNDSAVKRYNWRVRNRHMSNLLYNLGMLHSAQRAYSKNNLWLSGMYGTIDLYMFDSYGGRFAYEVKGPTDSLRDSQKSLLPNLRDNGWQVAVVAVIVK